jgi:hypothetical protein
MKKTSAPPVQPSSMNLETGISAPTAEASAGLQPNDRALREEILHRAYTLWENEGHPENRKLDNWLEAEASVHHTP